MPTKKKTVTKVSKVTKISKVSKPAKKPVKSVAAKIPAAKTEAKTIKPVNEKSTSLTVSVFDTTGKVTGSTKLPEKIFGTKINKALLSQALHIYFANSKTHNANTKTRGEVRGGGRKPWKQKGTGNARAGSKRSPLWVGGGIVFGPRTRDIKLELPKKMKRAALLSALSQKARDGEIKVIASLEKINPKTKTMANLLLKIDAKSPTLLVTSAKSKNTTLASRNIPKTTLEVATNLNAFVVWQNKNILISKDALISIGESRREKFV